MSLGIFASLAFSEAISARLDRAAEPRRAISSEEGGVGTTSARIRRSRESRAGELRTGTGFVVFRARCFRAFFADAAFLAFAGAFGFAARRRGLGRLAERAFR